MRHVSEDFDAEVAGSTFADTLEVNVWRGGELMAQRLDVVSWSKGWDVGRQVQGMATFVIADPDGALAPWGMGDALAPGGSRLQVVWVSGSTGARVPLGWWRIRTADPQESWRPYQVGAVTLMVPAGGRVVVRADEETATVVMERLDAEAVTAATCLVEVTRLLEDICAVSVDAGVTDGPVPAGLVYGDSRMDAVEDLLDAVHATCRMGPDGALEVVPVGGVSTPVWTIAGGDAGVLVDLRRSLSDEGVFNAAVSEGETPAGLPLIGRAYVPAGPLEWGGPFGRVPVFHNAVAQTQAGVTADASTLLSNRIAAGEVDLAVACLTHPGVQPQDRVTVIAATRVGDASLEGRVVAMSMQSAAGGVPAKSMSLSVRVSTQALEAVAERVRRG